ncbi:MlaD family protein [Tuwongella immobilis]|uniref:Mce/MlaD domain-containing protein n=1 Tax=Tuwongella immobilis TaxID=692036 RepID=A0A6C2YNJ5_9BACT|nr:MlaD family protein [Tuwongella immobilis]VIP02462.1 Hypothetical conserved protein OS=uncultured planctomycete GN=HGMM_F09D09C20 PE=4 SV=1: MCE [Tuwongella immobilis]VTS01472.1 Hypothetical conserved protein OS=uncultured planctomycete GN=HGMM_F09D09C20 PE=4 SV=1: MCE [Tuwongella immobilis]
MSDRGNQVRLGLFTLFAMGMLAALIFLFSGSPNLLKNTVQYVVVFSDAPGISEGAPVRRSGVRIGEVQSLELVPETGLVRVAIVVDPRYVPRTKEDITLVRGLITNDTSVDLIPRIQEKGRFDLGEPVPVGTELVGLPPPNARTILTQASEVLPTAQASLDEIRRSVQRIDKLAPRLEETLVAIRDAASTIGDFVPELRKTNDELRGVITGIRTAGPQLRETNEQVQVLLANVNTVAEEFRVFFKTNEPELTRSIKNAAISIERIGEVLNDSNRENVSKAILNVKNASDRFEKIAENTEATLKSLADTITMTGTDIQKLFERARVGFDNVEKRFNEFIKKIEPYEERFSKIVGNVESATSQINQGAMDVREVIRNFTRPDGTVQKLLTDPGIYNQTYLIVANLNRIIPRLDRILQDFEVFADKIARHPESIGVGGAVRPSSGLKESPESTVPRSPLIPPRP